MLVASSNSTLQGTENTSARLGISNFFTAECAASATVQDLEAACCNFLMCETESVLIAHASCRCFASLLSTIPTGTSPSSTRWWKTSWTPPRTTPSSSTSPPSQSGCTRHQTVSSTRMTQVSHLCFVSIPQLAHIPSYSSTISPLHQSILFGWLEFALFSRSCGD